MNQLEPQPVPDHRQPFDDSSWELGVPASVLALRPRYGSPLLTSLTQTRWIGSSLHSLPVSVYRCVASFSCIQTPRAPISKHRIRTNRRGQPLTTARNGAVPPNNPNHLRKPVKLTHKIHNSRLFMTCMLPFNLNRSSSYSDRSVLLICTIMICSGVFVILILPCD